MQPCALIHRIVVIALGAVLVTTGLLVAIRMKRNQERYATLHYQPGSQALTNCLSAQSPSSSITSPDIIARAETFLTSRVGQDFFNCYLTFRPDRSADMD